MRTSDQYIAAIKAKLREHAPDNKAPVPISMSEEDGSWWVFVHVKRPKIADFTIESEDPDLTRALFDVYRALCRYNATEATAIRFDRRLSIDYAAQSVQAG